MMNEEQKLEKALRGVCYECCCPCGCRAKEDDETVTYTGCLACSDATHDMHVVEMELMSPHSGKPHMHLQHSQS